FATTSDWGRIGQLLLQEGEWDGKRVISREYLREMQKPSPSEPTYGLGIWLANNEHQRRENEPPFLDPGIFYLDGRFKQRVYVIPDRELVIVRVGEDARGWEESALPNAVSLRWHLMTASLPLILCEGFLKTMAQLVWHRCPVLG